MILMDAFNAIVYEDDSLMAVELKATKKFLAARRILPILTLIFMKLLMKIRRQRKKWSLTKLIQ